MHVYVTLSCGHRLALARERLLHGMRLYHSNAAVLSSFFMRNVKPSRLDTWPWLLKYIQNKYIHRKYI